MAKISEQAYWVAVRQDLKVFMQQAFGTIYPGKEFMDNWHIDAIVHHLTLAILGKQPRLIVNLPPRQLKSFIVSVVLPAFILGRDPTAKIICISYSDELAKTLSRDFKRIVESRWYRRCFPHLRTMKSTEGEFQTDQGGSRYATSVGGSLTGRGGDFIIIDDPIKAEDAHSDKARESTNEWYRSTLLSRLDDKKRSVLIIVMQRLHVNDLTGFAGAGGGFHKLALPAIASRDEHIATGAPEPYFRREGELLHEAWEDAQTLARLRVDLGSYNFASQYQQHPETPEGGMFKRKWFKIVDREPPFTRYGHWFVTIDSAQSTEVTADYSVISLVYGDRGGYCVIHSERGRWDYEALKDKALGYRRRITGDLYYIVENAGSGISLIYALRTAGLRCFDYKPKTSKIGRAAQALPIIESGRVQILSLAGRNQWVEPYINEFVTFPFGRYDDQVDSLTQLLPWAELRVNPGGSYFKPGDLLKEQPA